MINDPSKLESSGFSGLLPKPCFYFAGEKNAKFRDGESSTYDAIEIRTTMLTLVIAELYCVYLSPKQPRHLFLIKSEPIFHNFEARGSKVFHLLITLIVRAQKQF